MLTEDLVAEEDRAVARFLERDKLTRMLRAFLRRREKDKAHEVALHLLERRDADEEALETVTALCSWSGEVDLLVRAVRAYRALQGS